MSQPSKDDFIKISLSKKEAALKNFLGTKEEAARFMSAVMHSIQMNPGLLECTPDSLLGAFMQCAAIGLFPSNFNGDCYVLPYKDFKSQKTFAQFQIGYRGFKTLALKNGMLRMGSEVVYEKDDYIEELGIHPRLEHKPFLKGDRGNPYRVYAWAEIAKGDIVFKALSKEQVMEIKATSKAKDSKFSPWNSNDPMFWMWQKTAIKQLAKLLPTSAKMDKAIYLDNVSERGGYIEGESSIVEAPFDRPSVEIAGLKLEALSAPEKAAVKPIEPTSEMPPIPTEKIQDEKPEVKLGELKKKVEPAPVAKPSAMVSFYQDEPMDETVQAAQEVFGTTTKTEVIAEPQKVATPTVRQKKEIKLVNALEKNVAYNFDRALKAFNVTSHEQLTDSQLDICIQAVEKNKQF